GVRRPVTFRIFLPRLAAQSGNDAPLGGAEIDIGVEDETFDTGAVGFGEDAMEVMGRHGIAGVRVGARGYPGDPFVRFSNGIQCAACFRENNPREELVREALLHIRKRVNVGKFYAEPRLHNGKAVTLAETRIPFTDLAYPPRDRSVH